MDADEMHDTEVYTLAVLHYFINKPRAVLELIKE